MDLGALRLGRGALALVALRLGGLLLVSAPIMLAAQAGVDASVGRMPHAVEHAGPLPLSLAALLLREAVGAAAPLLLFALPCFLLLDWLLTAAAAELLCGGAGATRTRIWQRLLEARRHLGVYLRVTAVGLVVLGASAGGIAAAHRMTQRQLADAELSVVAELVVLPGLAAAAAALWAALVGALSLSARVLCAVEDRRRALRSMLEAARLWTRRPRLPLLLAAVALVLELAGGGLLLAFYPPGEGALAGAGWRLIWLGYLAAHAYAWHVRIAWVARAYADPRHDDIRARGDAPLMRSRRAVIVRT